MIVDRGPWLDADCNCTGAERCDPNNGRWFGKYERAIAQQSANDVDRLLKIGRIVDPNSNVELPDPPVVVQYFANDLAIWDDDERAVDIEADRIDLAFDAGDRDVLTDAKRPGKDDCQSGCQVSEHALQR